MPTCALKNIGLPTKDDDHFMGIATYYMAPSEDAHRAQIQWPDLLARQNLALGHTFDDASSSLSWVKFLSQSQVLRNFLACKECMIAYDYSP